MSAKYYTQFILTDTQYRDGNEFSGVVELSQQNLRIPPDSPGLGRDFFGRHLNPGFRGVHPQ